MCFGNTFKKIDKTANIIVKNAKVLFNVPKFGKLNFIDYFRKGQFAVIELKQNSTFWCQGNVVTFNSGCQLFIGKKANLKINGRCSFNRNATLNCRKEITIGNGVLISQNVVIRDSDAHPINGQEMSKSIVISDNVLIGAYAIVLKGVTIGEGSVVGAGAVVTHDVPPHTVVAGNPAKVIKENINWSWH